MQQTTSLQPRETHLNISFLTVALTLMGLLILPAISMLAQPTIVAHRGASWLAPENTVSAYELAWELGVPAAECDIMLTADKQVILFHDKKGKRLTGQNFEVKSANYSDIKDLPIIGKESNLPKYAGETIPLLKEVLATIPEARTLVIEIKTGPEILPYLKEVINAYWKTGEIAFIAFDFETIVATKALFPDTPCYYLSMFKGDVKRKISKIKAANLDGVNLRHSIIDEELVNTFKKEGLGIWCWTVNDPADAKRLEDIGVLAITTDRPKWLKEQMGW